MKFSFFFQAIFLGTNNVNSYKNSFIYVKDENLVTIRTYVRMCALRRSYVDDGNKPNGQVGGCIRRCEKKLCSFLLIYPKWNSQKRMHDIDITENLYKKENIKK